MSEWPKCTASEGNPKALRCSDSQGNAVSFICPPHMHAMEAKGTVLGIPYHSVTCGTWARGAPETFGEHLEEWGWWLSKPANAAFSGACVGVALGLCIAFIIGRLRRRREAPASR